MASLKLDGVEGLWAGDRMEVLRVMKVIFRPQGQLSSLGSEALVGMFDRQNPALKVIILSVVKRVGNFWDWKRMRQMTR